MNRNRFFLLGCTGLIVLSFGLVVGIVLLARGSYDSAQARWDAKGSGSYTLVVSQYCFCALVGDYKITVQSGRVTALELVGSAVGPTGSGSTGITTPYKPSDFDRMTAGAMLSQARRDQSDAWTAPWLHQLHIAYDPDYGYVTKYDSDANGELTLLLGRMVSDSGYSYTAKDLEITQP